LSSLRESVNTSVRSEVKSSTPLATFLHIYNSAWRECYTDYMEGAKVLASFLAPIEIPNTKSAYTPPTMVCGYEMTELAKHLTGYRINKDLGAVRNAERAILLSILENLREGE